MRQLGVRRPAAVHPPCRISGLDAAASSSLCISGGGGARTRCRLAAHAVPAAQAAVAPSPPSPQQQPDSSRCCRQLPASNPWQQPPVSKRPSAAAGAAARTARSSENRCSEHPQEQQQPRRRLRQPPQQQQQPAMRLLAAGKPGPDPEPPATSGTPPAGGAGSSQPDRTSPATSSSSSSPATPEQQQQQGGEGASPRDPLAQASDDVEAAVDKMLDRTWQELKRDLKKEMSPEQAALIDQWGVADIQTDKVFRDIAQQQLGPILQMMGISEDPYSFFLDLFKLALMLQLGSAAAVFYGAELGLGLDAGEALRAVGGLALGYLLRLGVKIEHLAWPLYNAIVQLLITDDSVYEYPAATPEEKRDTLNRLGLAVGCVFLVPKFLFGWQNDECWQVLVPMVFGLFFFDVCYILALLIKVWTYQDDDR